MSILRIVNKTISGKVEKQNHVHRTICTTETLYYSCTLNDVTMTKPVTLTFISNLQISVLSKAKLVENVGLIISTIREWEGNFFPNQL